MQSTNLVDVNSLIDEQPSKTVDVNSLIEQPQKKNSLQPSPASFAPSVQPTLPSAPQSKSVESNPPVKPLLNTQQAAEKFGLTPIQNLQNQNVAKSDNTLSVPNAGVFNKQVNAFNEVTDKTITGNAPDESVVIRNEYQKKRKGVLNPEVVIPASQLTPENNFGLNANLNTPQVADNAVNKIQVKPVQGAPVNAVAPPTPEQEFKQKVSDNLSSLEKETIAKSGEYAMKVTSDPVAAGFITKAILGDNMAISQKRQIDKGYTVPQADLYQTGQVGITSMIAALDKKYESDPQNADYIAQKTDLENQAKNLIDKFPEYKVSQLTKAVAIELGKLHPEVSNSPSMARLYLPEIKKEMGLSDEDIKAIDFDNYPTSNFLTSTIAPIYKGALGLGLSATRAIGSALGADKDLLNSRLTEAAQSPTFFDDIETMQNTGQTVDVNKASPTFLQNIADPNKGKYNYNFHTISNAIGNGVGQLAWFVYGTKGAGAAANKALGAVAGAAAGDGAISLNGLPVKLSADATNEVGMAGLMMGQGYEDYYQKARTVISDKPEDELKRHAYSLINGALDYFGFRVLGNVVKGLPPAAEKEIGQIFKDAPNLAAVNKKALQSTLTKVLKSVGEATKETAFVEGATTASELAKAVVTNVMGNDEAVKEENKQLPDVILSSLAASPFQMWLPILGSKIIAGGQSKVHKENIYNAGISPENYKGDAHKLFDMGAINQEQLNDRIQVINTADKVVKSIPSDVFDNLNHNQRVTYVNSKIRELALKAKSEGVQDEALAAYYADQIKGEVAKRSDVLNGGGKEGEFPESVSVIKPKTQEEINNQIPTVTIEGKNNENITTQGNKQQQANSEQVAQSENLNFEPENKYQFYVTDVNQIPEQYRDRAVKTGETKSKKALFGIIPYGNESVTTHYRYELSGKEANDLVKNNNNAQVKTEVSQPTEAASTTNEAANKVEQPTEESLVSQAKDLVNSGVVKGFTAETLKESANNNPTEFQQHLKDISEQANDPKSNKATVDTYGKELVDIAQKLNPVEAKQANVKSEANLAVEPSKPISEMNSEEMYDYATKVKKELARQDKEFAGKTEAEKEAGGYYDVVDNVGELRDASTKINFIENSEGLNDLSSSVRSALGNIKDKPSEYDLAILNAAKKKAVELNIPTEDLIKEVIKKEGNRYKDANDAEFMMRNVLEKIKQPNDQNTTTPTEVNKPISVNEGEPTKAPKEKPISKPISEVKEKPSKPTNTKESNFSKKLKDKYKDFNLGGTKDADLSDKSKIKTDNGTQTIDEYVAKGKAVLNKLFPDATFEAYKTHKEFEKAGGVEDSRGTAITEADGSKRILLNLAQMKEDGVGKTAFHEVIHPIVAEVFGKTPEELAPIWNEIASTMKDVKGMDKVWEHLVWYSEHKTPVEGITEFLTQVADGNIKIEDIPAAKQSKIVDLINRLFEKLGINFKIEHPLDLQKFANDIKTAFETGDVESLKNTIDKRSSENKNASENASKINDLLFGKDADFGLSKGNIKENVDKSIEALRKMIDKGADLKDAIAKESDNFIKNIKSLDGIKDLKPTFEKTLRDNFEKEALNQFSKEQSDRAATVENMVKDAMDEGFETLTDIKEAITNGLGIDTPAFRKMIDDAYERVGGGGGKEPPESGMGVDNNSDTFSEWSRVNLGSLSKIKDQFRKIGISWDNRAESAMRNLQKRGRKGERLFDTALREMDNFHKSLSRGKTPRFNTDDQVAMHFLKIGTEQQIAKLKDNISEDYTDINSIGSDVLIDQYDRVNAVLGAMRSESGVGLAYGTVEARLSPDYGLKVRQMQMIRANDGEPLSEAQENLVKETWQKEKDLMQREHEYRTKKMQDDFDKQLSDLKDKYEKEIQDLKNGKKVSQKITKSRTKLSDNLLDIAKRIRESNEFDNYLKNRGNDTKAAGVTFDFKEGAAQAIEYVAKAVQAGEKVTDAISKAVEKYKADLDSKGVSDFKEKLSGLITKASLPDATEVLSKIKDIADNEKTTQITKGMVGKNLIRDLVDAHIADTKKEDILGEAAKKLQTVLPDATKENITEAYLRQGDFKLDRKSKLEDIVKKDKLALKRIAKDELTANQKQKIKLSQEKEKTKRRISELEDKLKNGEYDEEGQQIPVRLNRPDAELINFNREKNKLESVYRKEQEKLREKNRHIGFRIAETARALWVTILIGHPKTLAKIGWMMVLRPTSEATSKLTFGKAFDLISPEISSAAKAGGESNSIASVTKMSAAFFRQMGAEKLQNLYERGERKYYDALAKYEEYKNSSNPNGKRLKQLKRDMDNKMLATLGNTIYQFIGGSSLKDAASTLLHRANIIEKQFGKVSEEQLKGEDALGKTKYILGFVGRSHSALKTLSGRASFAAGFMARIEAQLAKGEHPNADKLIELAHESYIDWERGKYQQSNYISDKWNQMINSIDNRLHDKDKSWEGYSKATQLLARTDVAITRVPVNIIHEAVAEYLTGAFRAPILAKRAYNEAHKQAIKEGYTKGLEIEDGIEKGTTKDQFKNRIKEIVSDMDADKAATIVRLFRKGGLGMGLYAAALIWGGVHFGIFQHRGQKKVKEEEDLGADELNPGQVMFGNTKYGEIVSGMIEHTPALWPTFMGIGLSKMYHDDINNGKTTAAAVGDAIITHLKIIEGNIPQTKFIDPVEIGQTIYRNVEKKTKSISDTWGLTDNAEVRGGLPKNSKARQYLDEHNLEILVPEKYQVKVGVDKRHPYGRMTDEEYSKFKKIRSSLLNDRLVPLFEKSEGAPREKLKAEIRSISANATKQAKNRMIVEGDISRVQNDLAY